METRSVEIETQEVTRPDVAVSPDGVWLIFTALGHLFRLPVEGGTAEQLTFGPYFDSDPAISPDGRQVVFASDRDVRSDGNLFILDLADGDVRQLTEEQWAARPVWSPDGSHIAYLTYESEGFWAQYEFVAPSGLQTQVRRISLPHGRTETLTDGPGLIRDVFYFPDGRVAWTGVENGSATQSAQSRIDVMTSPGDVATLLRVEGVVDRVVPDPTGDGLYVRQYERAAGGVFVPQPEQLTYVSLRDQAARTITELSNPQPRPGFSVAAGKVYLGESRAVVANRCTNGSAGEDRLLGDHHHGGLPAIATASLRARTAPEWQANQSARSPTVTRRQKPDLQRRRPHLAAASRGGSSQAAVRCEGLPVGARGTVA